MRVVRRVLPVFMFVLLTIPFVVPSGAAEDPHNRACAGVVLPLLLCAGADAGADAGCVNDTSAEISCVYSYGWNLNASSSAQLPHGGRLNWTALVEACISGSSCEEVAWDAGEVYCDEGSGAAEPCWAQDSVRGDLDFVLALGQCVTVNVVVKVWSEAWSLTETEPLLYVYAEDASSAGGAACHLDDGR